MLQAVAKDYAEYLKLDLTGGFQIVQDVIDNMITRLEELTSVLQMIQLKNSDCSTTVTEDICRYRHEVTILSKKIITLSDIVFQLQSNIEVLEKRVEKAEADFGVNVDNRLKSFLKPFLKKRDVNTGIFPEVIPQECSGTISSVLDNFEGSNTNT